MDSSFTENVPAGEASPEISLLTALEGSDIQQKTADISDVLFKMDMNSLPEKICAELKYAADRLEAVRLPEIPSAGSRTAVSADLDRIDAARRETEEIISSLQLRLTEIYKADAAYCFLKDELTGCRECLSETAARLRGQSGKSEVTVRHISDLEMSVMVAERYIKMIAERRSYLSFLISGITSVTVNAVPLWRGAALSAYESPVRENISRADTLRQAMSAAVRDIAGTLGRKYR